MTVPPRSSPATALSLREIIRLAGEQLRKSNALIWLAAVGIIAGLVCLAVDAWRGGVPIGAEGDLSKPASFNIAIGIYLLTLAMLFPSSGLTPRGARRWIGWTIALFSYAIVLETVQTFRGLDPRFSRVGSPVDNILGGVFGLNAIGFIVLFVVLARGFFRHRPDLRAPVVLAIRYGCISTMAAFGAGVWMSAIQGRHTGAAGNVLPLHALGFHGLQAIPVIALLLVWSGAEDGTAQRWVHGAGLAWLAVCAAVFYQTFIGRSVFERSPAVIVSAFLMMVWAAIAAFAFWQWLRLPATPRGSPDISRTPTVNTRA
ncbi:MAG TPA: hypothetical protein VM166_12745 [Gemmatimonadaceae bacterium]|nr:hypothetical protein [Gemmatimonadaceae bacterium]